MKSKSWSEDEVSRLLGLYELGFPSGEIASKLGRSESSVRLKVLSMGLSSRRILRQIITSELPAPRVPEERIPEETATLEEEAIRLRAERELELREQRREDRSQVDDAKREILEQRIVDEFRSHLCDLPQSISVRLPPIVQASPSADVAVLVVGDVHIGQVVDPAESEGLGTYNPAVMIARVHHLQQEVMRILKNHPPKKLLLLFAGDMLHGQLGHTMEDDLTLPIAIQTDLALHTFFPFVAGLSRVVPEIEIHGVVGNHGRWPGMRKMPTDRRWSNLDSILYMSLAALCEHSGLSNVFYEHRISSRRMIDVDNFRIELLHGDEIRGGSFCVSGMTREVTNATLRNVQVGRRAPDLFICGDKHFSASLPFGTGAFIVNGSFVGTDNFGLNFIPSPPSQTLFFLDPALGRTVTHDIRLAHAEFPDPLPYDLKPHLHQLVMRHAQKL